MVEDLRRPIVLQLQELAQVGILNDGDGSSTKAASGPLSPDPVLENLAINLTRRCNLRCRFCYNLPNLRSSPGEELRADEISRFLKATRRHRGGSCVLTILGGEPLLEEDKLLAVAQAAAREGVRVLVSTNGTSVSERFARQARALKLEVQVSVDGPCAEMHDSVRGCGVFSRLTQALSLLARHGAHTIASMVCHEGNVGRLADLFSWARQAGACEARFIPLKLLGGAPVSGFRPAPLSELMRSARTLFEQHPEFLAMAGRDAFSILAASCRLSCSRASCGTGSSTLLLDADGSLYPCLNTLHPDLRLGSIRDPDFDFTRFWMESQRLRELREETAIDNPRCSCGRCVVRYWCLGGCKGETYSRTGRLSAPTWNCEEWRRAILDLFWTLVERPDLVRSASRIC